MGKRKVPGEDKIAESWVKDKIKDILVQYPALHFWMPPASMYGVSGQHDFIICHRSLCWTIEAKAGKNTPTDNQIVFANKVKAAGGLSVMVNEFTLYKAARVAAYVEYVYRRYGVAALPYHEADDFNQWNN